ncbi:MAG TPA: DNA ligase D [Burkholderiales bacterium]|nr:DNA ligase D [Burkholderiales bacterium]
MPRAKRAVLADPSAAAVLLGEYSKKRSFDATPEPAPAPAPGTGPLLFVVQMHSARQLHYDFRLECDGVLKSWAVPRGPSLNPADKRLAVMTEDHPYDYASFEGVIPPKQYGAGEVIVWDCGPYTPDEDRKGHWYHDRAEAERQVRDGIAKGKLSITLRGAKIKGSFALVRTSSDPRNWLLIKHKDRFAAETDVTEKNLSVLSGLAVENLKALPVKRMPASQLVPSGEHEALPAKLLPMLAESRDGVFAGAGWMWEPKLDGYRVLASVDDKEVKLRSRRGLDLTASFPKLVAELVQQQVRGMVLDGEIVAFGTDGRPSFSALQERVQLKTEREIAAADRATPTAFFCFDLLHFAGRDLRGSPYADRRRWLEQCLLPSPHVQLVHAEEDGAELYQAALASGFEGVIAKRKDGKYEAGKRSQAWLKIKPVKSAEFVVGGVTKGKGSRAPLGALLLGYWDGGKLRYCGHVGSGFDERSLARVKARLGKLEVDKRPFAEEPELHSPTTWVRPELVAEVEFQQWTPDGMLRAPVFLRLRDDVDAKSVRRRDPSARPVAEAAPRSGNSEIDAVLRQLDNRKAALTIAIGKHTLKLTHLDRVYWPADAALKQSAITKRDLLRYFAQVSPYMLTHLADRPLTMIRMPEGIAGERFYQKHWDPELPPFARKITIFSEHKDERHDYLVCDNLATLLWLAQSGTLEFHVWHSRAKPGPDAATQSTDFSESLPALEASILNYPDYVVFDIDPYIYSGREKPGDEPELNTVAFEKGKEVAFALRELLAGMSLEAVVKTSGKTGLHVFVPIERTLDFDAARKVSEMVGRHLVRLRPKDVTVEWSVPKRTGKIFMDYNMNVRGKTLNSAYSPRGAPGAPVSMPLTWEELARAHPLDFRIANAPERLAQTGDRWKDALTRKQSLERALERAKA